jgi:NADH-quinone oxidoreductase subunit N
MIASTIPVFMPAWPEILVAVTACGLLMAGLTANKHILRWSFYIAISVLLIIPFLLWFHPKEIQFTFNGLFLNDYFTISMKSLVLLSGALVLILTRYSLFNESLNVVEYPVLFLWAILGMMIMISAHDLLVMFVGVELQSLCLYILVAMRRHNSHSSEAALKYFILGALSTGIMLYGFSLVYGFTGTTHFEALERFFMNLSHLDGSILGPFCGVIFIIAALAFKISLAPFHMWAPDVYQGSPTAVTAFLATVPKVAGVALLTRVLITPFNGLSSLWYWMILGLAILSMAWGSIAALAQQNIKRLIAYSSIGHMGFVLIGVAVASESGLKAALVYLVFYTIMTIGFFGGLLYIEQKRKEEIQSLSDLNGIGRYYPGVAFLMGFMVFSMAGIPPLPGFIPKVFILRAAITHSAYVLAVSGVIYSVISCAYYLLIIKALFFDKPNQTIALTLGHKKIYLPLALILFGLIAILIGLLMHPEILFEWARDAATSLVYE